MSKEIEDFETLPEPITIEFMIPVSHASALTKVAREINVDILIDKPVIEFAEHRWRKVIVTITSYTELFGLGFQTGMDLFNTISVNPLREAVDIIQNKINKIKDESDESSK